MTTLEANADTVMEQLIMQESRQLVLHGVIHPDICGMTRRVDNDVSRSGQGHSENKGVSNMGRITA